VRWSRSNAPYETVLNEFFKGPGSTERYSYGWIGISNGFNGDSRLEVQNGIANVYLTGTCNSDGRDFNIADLITFNLKQFTEIHTVKIYDANGETLRPDGIEDSEPFCLSDAYTPPPTATPMPTRTATPTQTLRPTSTPQWKLVKVYFVGGYAYRNGIPPFERAGVRWARTNDLYGAVLDEYFKGPGYTEKYSYGWIALYNGFDGYERVDIQGNVAHVYLKGTCDRANAAYTIADLLLLNMKQFPEIQFVKIYDETGLTENPNGAGDSIPACLQP